MSLTETTPRAVLVGVQLPGVDDVEQVSSLTELGRLAKTLGLEVVARIIQKRASLAAGAVIGEGKLRELARLTGGTGVIPSGVPAHRLRDADEEAMAEEPAEDDAGEPEGGAEPTAPAATVVLVD